MIKRKRKHHNTIISGRKFTGTQITDDYRIKNIDVVADARYSDGLRIKTRVAESNPDFEEYKKQTFSSYAYETMDMAVKYNLSCQSHSKDKLEAEDLRFVRYRTFSRGSKVSFLITNFHVTRAVLTRYGEHIICRTGVEG